MRISQEKIYKRYAFIRKVYFATFLSIILCLPLIAVGVYVFEDSGTFGRIYFILASVYLAFVAFVLIVLRRFPNCFSLLSRYSFDPKECPYCGVKLRK